MPLAAIQYAHPDFYRMHVSGCIRGYNLILSHLLRLKYSAL
jgi:hypothetical protein